MTTLEVLTHDQRAQVHERTLYILERTGMRVDMETISSAGDASQ